VPSGRRRGHHRDGGFHYLFIRSRARTGPAATARSVSCHFEARMAMPAPEDGDGAVGWTAGGALMGLAATACTSCGGWHP